MRKLLLHPQYLLKVEEARIRSYNESEVKLPWTVKFVLAAIDLVESVFSNLKKAYINVNWLSLKASLCSANSRISSFKE